MGAKAAWNMQEMWQRPTDKWGNTLPKDSRGASHRPQCQTGNVLFLRIIKHHYSETWGLPPSSLHIIKDPEIGRDQVLQGTGLYAANPMFLLCPVGATWCSSDSQLCSHG